MSSVVPSKRSTHTVESFDTFTIRRLIRTFFPDVCTDPSAGTPLTFGATSLDREL